MFIAKYLTKTWRVLCFAVFFLWELLLANLRVAHDILTPRHRMRPGVIAIPLDARTDLEITLLSNFITLTPDSMVIDVSPDRRTLYVHTIYVDDVEAQRRKIKDAFERRLLEALR